MVRYPNVSSSNGGYLNFESHGYNYIKDNNNSLSSSCDVAQLVVLTTLYSMERSTISDISGNTIKYKTSFHYALKDKFGYFIQNSVKTLDQYGEWYYNPNTKKISVYTGGGSPGNNSVQVSAKD